MVDGTSTPSEWSATFRQKSTYMKSWKPASTPSNRDRLELYALHKQALQGDAPSSLPTSTSAADRAKYQAWKSKAGISSDDAMRLYCLEADRQVRVYGSTLSLTPATGPATSVPAPAQPQPDDSQQPRGLAAIPLLCAAASESRQAYLRRLSTTSLHQAWWRRQEPLTATPGTIWALPELALLTCASILERVSLLVQQQETPPPIIGLVPPPVIQSFLWPLHNSCLALWMGFILIATAWTAALELIQTVLFGSRRTGWSLQGVWKDQVQFVGQSVNTLTEGHQPLTARLVGLILLPLTFVIQVAGVVSKDSNASSMMLLGTSVLYCGALIVTWWYWFLIVPCLIFWWLAAAVVTGQCVALIELAGV